ncbi:hypothetical protein [Paenibacillus agilis]|uniref:Uncharacterized protein n=1 Tax=Paenibacillus agilis TaxID=3020863 RepID=A0A559IED7_9BACL|nr:hypothetical protein [Paenibacillus agilis]TVX86024.1 hypothetical protein FPZ44_24060 [Paenibacillus agilis]
MNSYEHDAIEEQVERWFEGYSLERVSNHLRRVVIGTTSALTSYKSFLGLKYAKEYDVSTIELDFTESLQYTRRNIYGHTLSCYNVECAIDEGEKIVYWKAVPMED